MKDGEKKIVFYGIMPHSIRGWIKLDPVVLTKWCGASLVLVEQAGLKEVLKDQDIQHIFFVSGDSEPLVSAKALYDLPDVTRPDTRGGKSFLDNAFRNALQWKAYSREDASTIARYDFTNPSFRAFDQKFQGVSEYDDETLDFMEEKFLKFLKWAQTQSDPIYEHGVRYYLGLIHRLRALEKAAAESKDKSAAYPVYCPDEFRIPSVLPRREHSLIVAQSKVDNIWPAPSPIEWTSWTEKFAMRVPQDSDEVLNLEKELRESCQLGYLFFRKLSSKLPEGDRPTWKFCEKGKE